MVDENTRQGERPFGETAVENGCDGGSGRGYPAGVRTVLGHEWLLLVQGRNNNPWNIRAAVDGRRSLETKGDCACRRSCKGRWLWCTPGREEETHESMGRGMRSAQTL